MGQTSPSARAAVTVKDPVRVDNSEMEAIQLGQ
jgi:hypothetical protein